MVRKSQNCERYILNCLRSIKKCQINFSIVLVKKKKIKKGNNHELSSIIIEENYGKMEKT